MSPPRFASLVLVIVLGAPLGCGGASETASLCALNPTIPGCGPDVGPGGEAGTRDTFTPTSDSKASDDVTGLPTDTVRDGSGALDTSVTDTGCVGLDCDASAPGEGSCEDVRACVIATCAGLGGDAATTCERGCYARGGAAGRVAYDAITSCVAGCAGAEDCAWGTCAVEEARCRFASAGSRDCEDIRDCLDDCDDDDHDGGNAQACLDACWLAGDLAGQAALISYLGCVEARCPGDPHDCAKALCGPYRDACHD